MKEEASHRYASTCSGARRPPRNKKAPGFLSPGQVREDIARGLCGTARSPVRDWSDRQSPLETGIFLLAAHQRVGELTV